MGTARRGTVKRPVAPNRLTGTLNWMSTTCTPALLEVDRRWIAGQRSRLAIDGRAFHRHITQRQSNRYPAIIELMNHQPTVKPRSVVFETPRVLGIAHHGSNIGTLPRNLLRMSLFPEPQELVVGQEDARVYPMADDRPGRRV